MNTIFVAIASYLDYVERAHKFTPTEDRKFYTVESKTMVDNLDEYFKSCIL